MMDPTDRTPPAGEGGLAEGTVGACLSDFGTRSGYGLALVRDGLREYSLLMSPKAERALRTAMQLPDEERAFFAERLIRSVDAPAKDPDQGEALRALDRLAHLRQELEKTMGLYYGDLVSEAREERERQVDSLLSRSLEQK